MPLDPIPNKFKKLQKVLISERILFEKTAIMHQKSEFSKTRGEICSIFTQAANLCNIFLSSFQWINCC